METKDMSDFDIQLLYSMELAIISRAEAEGLIYPDEGKTGDDMMLWLYCTLLVLSFAAAMVFVTKEVIQRHRQRKEDLQMYS